MLSERLADRGLIDEARALLYPPHPSIVPVEDSGQLPDGRVYLVGEDSELPLHLELQEGLSPDALVRIAEQIAPALDALHARGLLHGQLEVDSLVGDPVRLAGVGFGVFQGGTTQEWTGGRDPGRRVLSGRILRGVADRIEAVIWFSDLRGFTRITDSAPEQIIPIRCPMEERSFYAGGDRAGSGFPRRRPQRSGSTAFAKF